MSPPIRLYGMPGSLYTAKARAYLRKQHIQFEELPVGHPAFAEVATEVGRFILPVIDDEGAIIQDSTAIIDHVEAAGRARLTAYPLTPRHRVVSLIFELFGGEGLLRPAMHYRWNFDAENLAFLRRDFVAALAPDADRMAGDAVFAKASGKMRNAASAFGVSPVTAATVERAYAEFLTLFDAHLDTAPYLLGGRPTIGDYGLIAPLYAHLARDPAPARLMQSTARNVWRWTERMNAPEAMLDGFADRGEGLFADDAIPDTLVALLEYVAEDYLPELTAHVRHANNWLAERPDLAEGTNGLERPGTRAIGMADFMWRRHEISTVVMPYRFWMLQRVQDCFDGLAVDEQRGVRDLIVRSGLDAMLALRTSRRVERAGHLEVWGPVRNDSHSASSSSGISTSVT